MVLCWIVALALASEESPNTYFDLLEFKKVVGNTHLE